MREHKNNRLPIASKIYRRVRYKWSSSTIVPSCAHSFTSLRVRLIERRLTIALASKSETFVVWLAHRSFLPVDPFPFFSSFIFLLFPLFFSRDERQSIDTTLCWFPNWFTFTRMQEGGVVWLLKSPFSLQNDPAIRELQPFQLGAKNRVKC